jgi:bacillithiol biosynthesis deacetylase BshB1
MGTRGTLAMRAAEFDAASVVMGVSHHEMLALPDGRLSADEPSREAVIREIREHRPRVILLPYWEDRHPDHPAASRIIEEAAFLAGLKKRETGQEPYRPSQLVYYMSTWEFEPSFIVDVSDVIEDKRRTLQAYGTQVYNPGALGNEPPTFIASEQFHELLFARMAHYGHLIGRKYGEPFKIRGHLEVTDLLQAFGQRTF